MTFWHSKFFDLNLSNIFFPVKFIDTMVLAGIGTMTWSPLACGILTGKYDDGVPIYSRAALKGYSWLKDRILSDEGRRQQAKLREVAVIADRLGCSLSQLAIGKFSQIS